MPKKNCAFDEALQKARSLFAKERDIPRLLETLSNGVHFEQVETASQVTLVPSYWASPLVFFTQLENNGLLVLFGSRPETQDLIPGESLPIDLVDSLKAIADPTRLRILRYLAEDRLTPSELSRRLRLRPPTVIHHLNALRLAGLVEITLHPEHERGYTLRREALNDVFALLADFLTPNAP